MLNAVSRLIMPTYVLFSQQKPKMRNVYFTSGFRCGTRFRKHFELLQSHPADRLSRFESTLFSKNAETFTDYCRENVKKLAHLDYRRDDYLEFVELCTIFLDCGKEGHTLTFK